MLLCLSTGATACALNPPEPWIKINLLAFEIFLSGTLISAPQKSLILDSGSSHSIVTTQILTTLATSFCFFQEDSSGLQFEGRVLDFTIPGAQGKGDQ